MNENTEIEFLKNFYEKYMQAVVAQDFDYLNKIIDKNFTLTHTTGYVQSKDEWFDYIKN